jgi:hypothetical protein
MNRAAFVALALMAAGCASLPVQAPQPPITIEKPIPVSCVPKLGAQPEYPDSDAALKAAPSTFDRIKLLVAGRLMRIAYQAKLEAALAACG